METTRDMLHTVIGFLLGFFFLFGLVSAFLFLGTKDSCLSFLYDGAHNFANGIWATISP